MRREPAVEIASDAEAGQLAESPAVKRRPIDLQKDAKLRPIKEIGLRRTPNDAFAHENTPVTRPGEPDKLGQKWLVTQPMIGVEPMQQKKKLRKSNMCPPGCGMNRVTRIELCLVL